MVTTVKAADQMTEKDYFIHPNQVKRQLNLWQQRYLSSRLNTLTFLANGSSALTFTVSDQPQNGSKASQILQSFLCLSSNKVKTLCTKGYVKVNGRSILSSRILFNEDVINIDVNQNSSSILQSASPYANSIGDMSDDDNGDTEKSKVLHRMASYASSLLRPCAHNPPLHVIYEDDFCAVVFKPAGVHSSPYIHTLKRQLYTLQEMLPLILTPPNDSLVEDPLPLPAVCHRLDARVSGCVAVAKTNSALKEINLQFANHTVYKQYRALIVGELELPKSDSMLCSTERDDPFLSIVKDQYNSTRLFIKYPVDGRPADTVLEILQSSKCNVYGQLTRVALLPGTGRRHQLREHCALLGCPIMGDDLLHNAGAFKTLKERLNFIKLMKQKAKVTVDEVSLDGGEDVEDDSWSSKDTFDAAATDNYESGRLPPVRKGVGVLLMSNAISFKHPNIQNIAKEKSTETKLENGMIEKTVLRTDGTLSILIDEIPKFSRIMERASNGARWKEQHDS